MVTAGEKNHRLWRAVLALLAQTCKMDVGKTGVCCFTGVAGIGYR